MKSLKKKNYSTTNFRSIVERDIKSKYRIHDIDEDDFEHKRFDFMLQKNQSLINLIKKGEIYSKEEKQVFRAVRNHIKTFSSIRHILDYFNEKVENFGKNIGLKKYEFVYEFDLQPVSGLTLPNKLRSPFLIASCYDLIDIGVDEILSSLYFKGNYRVRKIKI